MDLLQKNCLTKILNLLLFFGILFLASCGLTSVKQNSKSSGPKGNASKDEFLWLEDIESTESLDWVKAQNNSTMNWFEKDKNFSTLRAEAKKILDSEDRIIRPILFGDYVYNFWKDAKNTRGLLRRMPQTAFLKKLKKWETVLDIDQLASLEKQNWVYKGFMTDSPETEKAMITLSVGGTDASVHREFDLKTKSFVKSGFYIPEGKSYLAWLGPNKLLVATNFGKDSMTTAGYPRMVKILSRGQKLSEAKLVFEGQKKSSMVFPFNIEDTLNPTDLSKASEALKDGSLGAVRSFTNADGLQKYQSLAFIVESYDFFNDALYFINDKFETVRLIKPKHFKIMSYFNESFLMSPRKPDVMLGRKVNPGQLLKVEYNFLTGEPKSLALLWDEGDQKNVQSVELTKNFVLLNVLDQVKPKIYFAAKTDLTIFKNLGSKSYVGAESSTSSSIFSDQIYKTQESFLTPTTLIHQDLKTLRSTNVQAKKSEFDAKNLVEEQLWATSKDGTKIPYFVIRPKNIKFDGSNKTLLYGYGGFEVSIDPHYAASAGKLWLERGGIFVFANIRGGGEFGPNWHQAALKTKRHKAFEDFIAVAEDLIAKKITMNTKLAIEGGSNGGLLVGTVMTMRPDLFRAVVCLVPLLDMLKYDQLLAGASWIGEYGDPAIAKERDFLSTYSPYQNVKQGVKYPSILLYTSTKDDRVHPGHARKMAALMKKYDYDVLYFENTEGGHAGSTNSEQKAKMEAMIYNFLHRTL